jgi:hypothetical protein
MLLLVGTLNVVLGLTALVNPRVVTVSIQGLVVGDVSDWGRIYALLGVAIVAVSVGLFAVREWARWLAIVDVIVIYQLSMHWSQPGEGTG